LRALAPPSALTNCEHDAVEQLPNVEILIDRRPKGFDDANTDLARGVVGC
jgi:hypothetical protein